MNLYLSDCSIKQNVVQTKEIQAVLDEASSMGGASLYLEKGAVLKGSDNWDDYRTNGYLHNEMQDCICRL